MKGRFTTAECRWFCTSRVALARLFTFNLVEASANKNAPHAVTPAATAISEMLRYIRDRHASLVIGKNLFSECGHRRLHAFCFGANWFASPVSITLKDASRFQ